MHNEKGDSLKAARKMAPPSRAKNIEQQRYREFRLDNFGNLCELCASVVK